MNRIKMKDLVIPENSDLEKYLAMISGVRTVDEVWIDGTSYDIDFIKDVGSHNLLTSFSFDILTGKLVFISMEE